MNPNVMHSAHHKAVADANRILELTFDAELFGSFDQGVEQEILQRPYHFFDRVRAAHGTVPEADNGCVEGLNVARMHGLDPSRPMYLVLSFNAVQKVLRNPEVYHQGYDDSFRQLMGRVPAILNPPEHTKYRALINKAFGRIAVEDLSQSYIGPVAETLVDRIRETGTADLVTSLAGPLPFLAIGHILGLPIEKFPVFAKQVHALMAQGYDPEAALLASQQMGDVFGELIDERTAHPGDDLLTSLVLAEVEGERLSREDVIAFCRLLTPAGMETTMRTIGNMMVALLRDERQFDLLRRDRSLIPRAVQETLRWEGPSVLMPKTSVRAAHLEGVSIPKGAYVIVTHGYANHDPERWDRPHEFDITRERKPHLAYSAGPHTCAGNQLANKEMELALASVLNMIPSVRLDPEKEAPKILGLTLRSPTPIWVQTV